jgi:hypothetical protein
MTGFGKIKGAISLPTTTALNSAVYGIYTLAEAEAYRKLGRWPTAPTFPGAPTSLTATAGNSRASLSWSAPSDNGGASVTDYSVQYSSDNGSTWSTFSHSASTSTAAVVTGLSNDTAYVFRVAAVNSVGAGTYTAASSQITPQAPPADDPYYQRVELLVHFDPADMGGGANPVDSSNAARAVYMNSGSIVTDSGSLSPIATTGGVYSLTGGSSPFPLMAYGNGLNAGTGDYTLEWWWKFTGNQGWITHRTNGHTPGDYWLRVVNNGNTDKFLTCQYLNPSSYNIDNVWAVSVTALVNQWAHVAVSRVAGFTRVFINGQQATLGTATNGDSPFSTTAAFTADPAVMDFQSDNYGGNDHIAMVLFGFSYEITSGYVDDLRYTVGLGRYTSNFSPPTGPFSNTGPAMAPGQPRSLTATAGEQQVSLSWTAPLRNGGASITDYIVQYSSDSGSTWTTFSDGTSTSTSATVTGLTNSTTYKFRVAAVNNVGAGAYAVSGNATPSAAITITAQPKNDYATASNQNVTFTVAATGGGGSLVYQWQYYGADYNNGDYDYIWRNISGATSTSYTTNGNTLSNLLSYDFYYLGVAKLRCAVSPSSGGSPTYTDIVRFIELDYLHYANSNWYGNQGNYVNYVYYTQPQTFSPNVGENLVLDLYDYAMAYPDTSWYTGNDTTLKIQVATNGYTDSADWTDLYTADFRGYAYLSGYNITPSTGTKYYRAILVNKWPWAVNNGTQSATHATPYAYPHSNYDVVRVTWPSAPAAPTNITATAYDSAVELLWTPPGAGSAAITDYVIQYTADGGAWNTVSDGTSTDTSFVVANLTNGTPYQFRIAAVNAVGTGTYGTSSSVTPVAVAGVHATGGLITIDGDYVVHTFKQSGSFVSNGTNACAYLMVGGGGGGGGDHSGGGGGGQVIIGSASLSSGTYPIVIGAGGSPGGPRNGVYATNGGNTTFNGLTAFGGGGGGQYSDQSGSGGASGGGGASFGSGGGPGLATNYGITGYNGAAGNNSGAGGGGGAGGNGSQSAGGPGISSSITGTTVGYGGGGGGANNSNGYGADGGGNGDATSTGATSGKQNTGGGGGGNTSVQPGTSGGSGIVVIRYPKTQSVY